VELTTSVYAVLKETFEDVKPRKPWLINKSVFEPRRHESDAKAYLDTSACEKLAYMADVKMIFMKPTFITFCHGTCSPADRVSMIKKLKEAVEESYQLLTACFSFFSGSTSGMGGEGIYSMGLNEWSEFTLSTGCINENANGKGPQSNDQGLATLRRTDADGVFIAANFEDKSSSSGGLASQFLRHEFIEAAVRLACVVAREQAARASGEHDTTGRGAASMIDAGDAVRIFCRDYVEKNVRPDIQYDSNEFRTEVLYYEEVDLCFTKHIPILKAIYLAYRVREQGAANHRPKCMNPGGWDQLMKDCDLLSTMQFSVMRLGQMQARMLVVNGNDRDRNSNLTFVDFLEALGRLAHYGQIPTMEEVMGTGYGNTLEWHMAQQVVVAKERTKGQAKAVKSKAADEELDETSAAAPKKQSGTGKASVALPGGGAKNLRGRGTSDHLALKGSERADDDAVLHSPGKLEARLDVLLDLILRRLHYGCGQVAGDTSQALPINAMIHRMRNLDKERGPTR